MAVLNSQMFIVSAEEIHDVAITGVVPDKTTVVFPDDLPLLVSVNCTNRGTEDESPIVMVFLDAPDHPYCWFNITLASGIPYQFIFPLYPSLHDLGTWNLGANVSIVPGETNTVDNVYIYGPITVKLQDDVAVTNVVASQTHVNVGDSLPVNVSVRNLGMHAETFTVTAYFGSGKIGFDTETVTLDVDETRTLNMIWDTTGVVPNSYQIGAYASLDDWNVTNNNYTGGWVMVTWQGDLTDKNHLTPPGGVPDGKVDENDDWYFCGAFIDYYKIPSRLDANCDFDNNHKIDEDDLWTFCGAFIDYWKAH